MRVNSVFFIFSVLFFFNANAQNLTTSSYSIFGIGDKEAVNHPIFQATGNITGVHVDSTILNFYNPASYSLLKPGKILFSSSLSGNFSFFNQGDQSSYFPSSSLHHIALALNVKKHFGISFGLKPYLSRGYFISDDQYSGLDSLSHTYEGSGNTQQLYFGAASNILNTQSTNLSIGANLSYLFGSVENLRKSKLLTSTNTAGGVEVNQINFSSFHYKLGLYFKQRFGFNHSIKIGASVEPTQVLNSNFYDALYYSENIEDPSLYDTLFSFNCISENCNINIPTEVDLSFSYSLNFYGRIINNKKRLSQLNLMAAYRQSDWSSFTPHDGANSSVVFGKNKQISFGFQFIPEMKYLEKALITKWYERLNYRLGYFDQKLPYTLNGLEVHDFGMTFGLGMPIVIQQSLSSLNLSVVVGKRGVGEENFVEERYVGINFGLILSPSNFSRWFRKRKLD